MTWALDSTLQARTSQIGSTWNLVQRTATLEKRTHKWASVREYDATGDGVADDGPAFVAAFTENDAVHVPVGQYRVTSSLTIPDRPFRLVGDGYGSRIFGSFPGYVLSRAGSPVGPYSIEGLRIGNAHASGGALRLNGVVVASVRNCRIEGNTVGLEFSSGSFSAAASDCIFVSSGSGIGILGGGTFTNCDVVGWSEGIRHFGTGLAVVGGRYEVNGVAIRMGVDGTGADYMSSRCSLSGISFEANDTAIRVDHAAGLSIAGCGVQGSANSPSQGSVNGLYLGSMTAASISGCSIGGAFSGSGIRIAAVPSVSAFTAVHSENSGAGTAWDATGVSLAGAAFVACDASAPKQGL